VVAAARALLTELADRGITAAKLAAFKKKIDAFDGIKTSPRAAIVQRKAANLLLPKLVCTAVNILNDQLDGLLVQFKDTNPNFYEEYFAARAIVDTRSTPAHLDKKNSAFNQPNPTPTPTPTPA